MAINSFPIETTTVDINSISDNVALAEQYKDEAESAKNEAETARDDAQTAAGTDYMVATWAELALVSGMVGEIGRVDIADTGTHTDPITASTVANSGFYVWEVDGLGSAQAKWVGDTGLAGKADKADLDLATVTSGNVIGTATFGGYGQNGGSVDNSTGTVTIPSASTGDLTKIAVDTPIDVSELLGETLIIRTVYTATEGFYDDHEPNPTVVLRAKRDGTGYLVGSQVTSYQVGQAIIREAEYTITSDDVAAGSFTLGDFYQCINGVTGTAHEMQAVSTTWRIKTLSTSKEGVSDQMLSRRLEESENILKAYSDTKVSVVQSQLDTDVSGQSPLGRGSFTVDTGQELNGGVGITYGGIKFGITIPVGETGHYSHVTPYLPLDLSEFAGGSFTMSILVEKSSVFDPAFNVARAVVRDESGSWSAPTQTSEVVEIDDTHEIRKFTFEASGDEREVGFSLQIYHTGAASAEQYYEVTDFGLRVSEAESDLATRAVLNSRLNAQIAKAVARREAEDVIEEAGIHTVPSPAAADRDLNRYDLVVTVAPSGADYTTLADALQAIIAAGDASETNVYQVRVGAGVYTDHNPLNGTDQWVPDYVDVVFEPYAAIAYDGDNTADPSQSEAINISRASKIYGLDVSAKDARYAIHSETNGAYPNIEIDFDRVSAKHLGNADNAAERGVDSWLSTVAFGSGLSSGQIIRSTGSDWMGDHGGFGIHNNRDFTIPMQVFQDADMIGVRQDTPAIGALSVQMLGSGTKDRWLLRGVSGASYINLRTNKWLSNQADRQVADRYEVEIRGYACAPMPALHNSTARALRIDTLDTTDGNSISISGTAADALMDLTHHESHASGDGLPAFVRGHWNIVDEGVGPTLANHITSMGYRLGDCSVTPKDLVVTVSGTDYTVTFNSDMTSVDNATILSSINAVIGSVATAYEFDVTGTRHPIFTDTEWRLIATEGIPRKSAVAYDGDYRHVRLMTSADDTKLFAGIAMEDVYPGEDGRVKFSGLLDRTFVRGAEGVSASFMDTLSVDASEAGSLTVGGSQGLLTAMDSRTWKIS